MVEHRQAVIPLSIADSAGFDSFHSEENEQLIGQLKLLVAGDRVPPVMFLYGEPGSGKTHLMHICGEIAAANQRKHLYLSVDQSNPPPEFLIDIHGETLVCLDGFDRMAKQEDWLNSIFTLYERLVNSGGGILVAANKPLHQLSVALPDLESRLSSGGVYCLRPLGDNSRREALKSSAQRRGFELNDTAINFIMTHYQRDTSALFALLDRIDSASMAERRQKITVPFVKKLL